MSLRESIEDYFGEMLKAYTPEKFTAPKIFRDGMGGLFRFNPWEINIIDSPLLQRLRYIHQTGLAYLTYPSANHNRFEHSLGVTAIVSKIAESLRSRKETKHCISDPTLQELRFAGLLHDIGHGPFSHVTEEIITQLPEIRQESKNPKFSEEKPHETLSYLIVRSEAFKGFFEESLLKLYGLTEVRTERIANMIVGAMDRPDREGYTGDMINGPFDADKLDYLMRDAHSTGIKMSFDIERYLYTILVDVRKGKEQRLIQELGGAHMSKFCSAKCYFILQFITTIK